MHIRSMLAGVGLAAAVGVGSLVVVSTASADDGGAPATPTTTAAVTTTSTTCPRQQLRQQVKDYLAAHPDVAQELKTLRALPQGQRAAARKQYLAAHPEIAQELKTLRADRRSAWWEEAGNAAATLQAHPDLSGLLHQLADAPPGQRQAVATQYLAQHPGVRAEVQQIRRDHAQACRAGN